MKYVPVIIPTLCRFEQLKNCIISLKKNKYAESTELYIGLDYPANESHWKGYNQIISFLEKGVDGFFRVNVIKHEQNQGWYQNYNILRNEVYKSYDRYIYTEDDNIFSPNFLEYMNKNMEKYQDDETVLAVSGYSYPVDWNLSDKDVNTLKLNVYFSAWGYGIWKFKEKQMLQFITLRNFDKLMKNSTFMRKLRRTSRNQYCNLIKGMVEYTNMLIKDKEIMTIDLSYGIYMLYENKYMIFPVVSKVKNTGYGAGGLNCKDIIYDEAVGVNHRNYVYAKQPIDSLDSYILTNKISNVDDYKIIKNLNEFFTVSFKEYFRCQFTWVLYKIFGKKLLTSLFCRLGH